MEKLPKCDTYFSVEFGKIILPNMYKKLIRFKKVKTKALLTINNGIIHLEGSVHNVKGKLRMYAEKK